VISYIADIVMVACIQPEMAIDNHISIGYAVEERTEGTPFFIDNVFQTVNLVKLFVQIITVEVMIMGYIFKFSQQSPKNPGAGTELI
jgi:tetrahydromethanopterin S-methyltransferase subunit E